MAADPLARPIFVVAPPRAGSRPVAATLQTSPGCWTAKPAARALLAPIPEPDPPDGSRGGRLAAGDCTPELRHELRALLQVQFAQRHRGASESDRMRPRLLHFSPRGALSVSFLDAAFPDATFVYVHRPPADTLAESLLLWRAETAVTYPDLPGWTGPPWSFLLVPGWRELIGRPLAEIVAEQWLRTMRVLVDDLERLAPDRWCVADHDRLRRDPQTEADRLTRYLGLEPGSRAPLVGGVRFPSARLATACAELEPYLDRTRDLAERAADWLAG